MHRNARKAGGALRRSLLASAAAGGLLLGASNAYALAPAGETIENQATATYDDQYGNSYTSTSNLATVTVEQVYFATLTEDRSTFAASSQTVYFQHLLKNTGNGDDTYTINVAQNATGADTGDFLTLDVYHDLNDNGVVDAGEPSLNGGNILLSANQQVSLVVAGALPAGTSGDTYAATLTTTSANGTVDDLTAGDGLDGLENTNEDIATITDDAVLNAVKSYVHDAANNRITYTVEVSNTGAIAAGMVTIFDGLPAGTTLVGGSVSGAGYGTSIDANDVNAVATPIDENILLKHLNLDGDQVDITEAEIGLDLNSDGTIGTNAVSGAAGHDFSLPSGTTVNLVFTVEYDPAVLGAGAVINNTAHVVADTDGDGDIDTDDNPEESNETTVVVDQDYGVIISDTGASPAAGVNDGGDDDSNVNDDQYVDTVAAGAEVIYFFDVTNTGNGADIFDLTATGSTYPPGTVFTFWNASGTVQLLDTNGSAAVDTGPMAAGATQRIQVRVQLPPGASGAGPFSVGLTAESQGDTSVTDPSQATLGNIDGATVDLTNTAGSGAAAGNQDAYGMDGVPVTTFNANVGDVVVVPLFLTNESGVPDSFSLEAGGSVAGAALGALPAGWSVVFKDSGGVVITTTPAIPAGSTFNYTAEITVPTNMAQALADRIFNIDGTNTVVDTPSDGDGDYAIFLAAESVNTGARDYKLDAVDVAPVEAISLLQDGANQVAAGGVVNYPHVVSNDGNTDEVVSLSTGDSASGWASDYWVDTTGDGTPDTPGGTLSPGDTVYYLDETGTLVAGILDGTGGLPLGPGDSLPFEVVVLAPSSAPNGQINLTDVQVDYNGGGSSVNNTDTTNVVTAQLRLDKTASVDATCAGAGAGDLGPDIAFSTNAASARPDDCVIWQVVATNSGVEPIQNVQITDAIPAYSLYEAGTLRMCYADAGLGTAAACTFDTLTDAVDGDKGEVSGTDVIYDLDGSGNPAIPGGIINPGESVTVRFATRVE